MAKVEPSRTPSPADAVLPESAAIVEGRTKLLVPPNALTHDVVPRRPAFFNPHARLARDLSVAVYRVFGTSGGPAHFADALAGVGARALRVAVEVPAVEAVWVNDVNPIALEYARRASLANHVSDKCTFANLDACTFLASLAQLPRRPEIVDIDPFGTPAPYFDCALRAVRGDGLVSATATDTAVLCGVYPEVAFRRYYGYSLRTEYCHELGLRLLMGGLAFVAMRLDLGIIPLFAHSSRHYMRVYARVVAGATHATLAARMLGRIWHCFGCGFRAASRPAGSTCPACGADLKVCGPLWLGSLYDTPFLLATRQVCGDQGFQLAEKLVVRAAGEAELPPTYFVPDVIADRLNLPSRSPDAVVAALTRAGYRAARTALNPRGVRTDASAAVVQEAVSRGG